jgi:hypothetical protein
MRTKAWRDRGEWANSCGTTTRQAIDAPLSWTAQREMDSSGISQRSTSAIETEYWLRSSAAYIGAVGPVGKRRVGSRANCFWAEAGRGAGRQGLGKSQGSSQLW